MLEKKIVSFGKYFFWREEAESKSILLLACHFLSLRTSDALRMGDPFNHVPTSSCREVLRPTCDLHPGRLALKKYEYDHGFKFQTSWTSVPNKELSQSRNSHSQRQTTCEKQRARSESLPTMSFADELFCDGKVMPLRPPPRFYCGKRSPDASPLTSPYTASRLLLQRRKTWNDGFDPFAAALEKVREEDRGRIRVSDHRHALYLSPFRAFKSRTMGGKTSLVLDQDEDQRNPDENIKTDPQRRHVDAEISKKQGLKRLFSFASLSSSSSCLRPQIYHPLHPHGEKPTKRR